MAVLTVEYKGTATAAGWLSIPIMSIDDITVQDNKLYIPTQFPYLSGIFVKGTGINNIRLVTPSFRKTFYPVYSKSVDASTGAGAPPITQDGFTDLRGKEVQLTPTELMDVQVEFSVAGTASVVLFFTDAKVTPATQVTTPLYLTNAAGVTLVEGQPAIIQLQTDYLLEAGTWQLNGVRVLTANDAANMARVVAVGQAYRPGTVPDVIKGWEYVPEMTEGQMGVLATFRHDQIPKIELLGSGATGKIEVYFDIVKIA